MDLEYVLGVIADGPTKSYAFRRLNYLSSKFTMYLLLNEFQELADMKVCLNCHLQLFLVFDRNHYAFRASRIGMSFAPMKIAALILPWL